MPETRYIATLRRIEPERRDVARAYADAEELNPSALVGEVAQNVVTLSEEGAEAYRGASNLLLLEEDGEAHIDGFVVQDEPDVSADAAGSIPEDADLKFLAALAMREKQGKNAGKDVRIAVLDQGLGAPVAKWLRDAGILAGAYSTIGQNPTGARGDHGTHVATTACPDGAKLYHYQVLADSGSGPSSGIIKAIYHAVDTSRAEIINMSLGGSSNSQSYETAIRYARSRGCLVFCAAGNTGREEAHYPASVPSAISVSAYDRTTGQKATFSTFHATVDLASSGVRVLAYLASGALGRMSGTSMATPLASFVAALLMGATGQKGEAVLQAMRSGARDMSGPATYDGAGLVQGAKTLRKLRGK